MVTQKTKRRFWRIMSERVWNPDWARYIVSHHEEGLTSRPAYVVWDRKREIFERRFTYSKRMDGQQGRMMNAAVDHAKQLNEKKGYEG